MVVGENYIHKIAGRLFSFLTLPTNGRRWLMMGGPGSCIRPELHGACYRIEEISIIKTPLALQLYMP